MRRFVTFGPAFVVMLAACVALLATPRIARIVSVAKTEAMMTVAQRSLDDDDVLERMNRAIRNVAVAVEPSVVHVDVRFPRDPEGERLSSGSGWVFDDLGHIVTNAHVVRDASAITVQFYDGRLTAADLVGTDPFTDIAVLKVDQHTGLFAARRATGESPQQGDRVFAFGSPFGFKFSMSEGIVSGLGRSARPALEGGFSAFIQTDAAVNPGNSGGPLVDIYGRVIGMNVAIATAQQKRGSADEGQSSGISFAIPLGTIESIVGQLIKTGKVTRGFLGITFGANTEGQAIQDATGFHGVGVLVDRVSPGEPADKAGLRRGDIITMIGDQNITNSQVLRSVVSSNEPGKTVKLKVWRDGGFTEMPLVLGEMPANLLASEAEREAAQRMILELPDRIGMMVRATRAGLRVDYIDEDSPAAKAGIKLGQFITSVAGNPVTIRGRDPVLVFYLQLAEAGLLSGGAVALEVQDPSGVEPGQSATPQQVILQLDTR